MDNMVLYYDDILVRQKSLVRAGELHINSQSIAVIKGKNGIGKSLLMKNILFNQKNETFSMVLLDQDNEITLDGIGILDTIALTDETEKRNRVTELLKAINCEYILELKNGKLSGGEQRLINILRAVCSDADIILMDEPSNDLDYEMVDKVIQLFHELKKEKSIIIISHDDRIVRIADCVMEIENQLLITKSKKSESNTVLEEKF